MCADDVVCTGAEPLFFLDYVAVGRLVPEGSRRSWARWPTAARQAGCALVGGETAEHPGLMEPDEFDLAGFCVGVVERDRPARRDRGPGRATSLVGLAASGLHANGFSLVRALVVAEHELDLGRAVPGAAAPDPRGPAADAP